MKITGIIIAKKELEQCLGYSEDYICLLWRQNHTAWFHVIIF